jgi:hypothetical protein
MERVAVGIIINPFRNSPWNTAHKRHAGFVIFRSKNSDSGYSQICTIIRGNTYYDEVIVPGETYYYELQYLSKNGNRSEPSIPVSITVR